MKRVITAYPDYSSGGEYVTQIVITDPEVRIYGIPVTSSYDEFDVLFGNMGYNIEDVGNTGVSRRAVRDRISYTYGGGIMMISAEVTNIFNIQF